MSILHEIALTSVAGIGHKMARQLIAYLGSAEEVLAAPAGKLMKVPGVAEKTIASLKQAEDLSGAESVIKTCEKFKIDIINRQHPQYPARLRSIDDAPYILYTKGRPEFLHKPCMVAVVGTRKATGYGIKVTEMLVDGLKEYDCTIVSGLAYGIDAVAHKAALNAGLGTVAVTGTGLDIVYPASHSKLAYAILEHGTWVSEYPPGTKPEAYNFPSRNRIIAALADVTLVAEAADKGGALITAVLANDYNREVMAIPGPVDAPYSAGCNQLIKTHKAHLCTCAKDLTELMNWLPEDDAGTGVTTPAPLPESLSEEEKKLVLLIQQQGPLHIDIITRISDVPLAQLPGILLSLEFSGIIKALPGKLFALNNVAKTGRQLTI